MEVKRALGIAVPIAFFVAVGVFVWTADDRAPSAADRAIVKANVILELPRDARRLGAKLGGTVQLAAASQEAEEAMPGEETKATLYWRCLAPARGRVFVHLEGPDGTRANLDHDPVYGLYPLSDWRPGEIVRDEVWITFDERAAPGEHVLWVGVYDGESRLAVDAPGDATVDAEGRVRAAGWRVR